MYSEKLCFAADNLRLASYNKLVGNAYRKFKLLVKINPTIKTYYTGLKQQPTLD